MAGKIIFSKSATVAPRTVMRNVAVSVTTFGAVPACVNMAPTIAPFGNVSIFMVLMDWYKSTAQSKALTPESVSDAI